MVDTPFAISDDLEARWRPLTDNERTIAGTLLEDAADIIRDSWPDVDDRVVAGTLRANSLTRIACAMVKRALIAGDFEGVSQQGQAAGPFNVSQTFSNPNGNLYLTSSEQGILNGSPKKRAFAVDLAQPRPDYCW